MMMMILIVMMCLQSTCLCLVYVRTYFHVIASINQEIEIAKMNCSLQTPSFGFDLKMRIDVRNEQSIRAIKSKIKKKTLGTPSTNQNNGS